MLALLLLAVALGLSNFAAAIGIGVSGVRGRDRVRIAVVFGVFEAGMPVLGVVLGQGLASSLGHVARWLGGAALIVIGVTGLVLARRGSRPAGGPAGEDAPGRPPGGEGAPGRPSWRLGRVIASGLALSADTKYCSSSVAVVRPPLQELCSTAYIPRSANPVTSGCCQWR